MAGILDFEAIDDILILIGIIALLFGELYIGLGLIVLGFVVMRLKGEGGRAPPPQDRESFDKIDTGTDEDYESGDAEGDDSDDGSDGDDGDSDGGDDGDDGDD